MKYRRSSLSIRSLFLAVILLIFFLFSLISLHLVRNFICSNTQIMGEEIARSFSVNEDSHLYAYELLLKNAVRWLQGQLGEGNDQSQLQEWMQNYLTYIQDTLGSQDIDLYAVLDGCMVGTNDWECDTDLDPTEQSWYQMAIAAKGTTIYSDSYTDAVTGQSVITIAQSVGSTENVLAIDLYPQHFQHWANVDFLPPGSSYFLCDSAGTVLCYTTNGTSQISDVQSYADALNAKIESGELSNTISLFRNSGERYGVYHRHTTNGWISIITIPYQYLFHGLDELILWYVGIFTLFLLLSAMMYLRERHLNHQVALNQETVRILGESYYAIYRINFHTETYTMLKHDDAQYINLPPRGDYKEFLNFLHRVMDPEVYAEFEDSFSLSSIRRLVERKVRDYGGDFQRRFPDGNRWVNVRLLFDNSLRRGEAILCFREVDEEKRRQLQHTELLKESLLASQNNAKVRSLFFANMSHDMRTPLNAILGLSELATHTLNNPQQTEDYLHKITLSSKHLLNLINDVLEMSKYEQGHYALDLQPFDLQKQLEEMLDVFHLQAQQEHKRFQVCFQIHNTRVEGDFFRIQQILNNLLSNAFKFTAPGQSISLSVRQLDDGSHSQYQFVVADTGAGMSKEFLSRLFVPFERETRFGAKYVSGTGLGMPIVHNIVLQMGGEIHVESALGEGTTITVTLPLALQAGAEEPAAPAAPVEPVSLSGRRLLLAEDNPLNMELATEMLRLKGVEVTQAWNGREAVEQFQSSPSGWFDAILMDMQMPEMSGCEAARAIRALPRPDAKEIPIVAVTANAYAEDVAATLAAGMNAHIAKPIDFSLLEQTLGRFLTHT
ncbi:MAG TPA: response regulator [Candidatus Flavonifractor merdigallinarum]|uniref:Stage 0 sporulation protein A homolog n=1 Tax=Candidatus Flavonifractor merdigallinarum TaxID=2838589 RepID=A0A9D2C0I9_9FIRM|nr:response regulator [Candidatus Flavonifractor merdigallinarum]